MDDDYAAGSVISGGKIWRRGYTARRSGRAYRVKASRIADRGARGRWQTVHRSKGIGALKHGDLTSLGYSHTKSATVRHTAISKAVSKYGRAATIRKINALAVYSKRTGPSRSKTYRTDMHYVQKKFA